VQALHYVTSNKNEAVLEKSSSGGVFTALSEYVIEKNGVVFGAVFDSEKQKVLHKMAHNMEEISKMRKSKYVWSDFTACFSDLEETVKENKYVLFTGTPCQCEVIRKKYGSYDKIIIVDFFCHGTGDAELFKEYLSLCIPDCDFVDFRGERAGDDSNFYFKCYDSSGEIIVDQYCNENLYTYLWIKSAVMRDSCFDCPFATKKHSADITMGDFPNKDIAVKKGINANHPSIVCINTNKGNEIWNGITPYMNSIYIEEKFVQSYYQPHIISGDWGYNKELKKKFLDDKKKYGFVKAGYLCLYHHEMEVLTKVKKRGWRDIYLYGSGVVGKRYYEIIKALYPEMNVCGFVQSVDVDKDRFVNNIPIITAKRLMKINPNAKIFITVSDKYQSEVIEFLEKLEFKHYL